MISLLLVVGSFILGWVISSSIESTGLVYAMVVLSGFLAGVGFHKTYKIHPGTSWWMIFFYIIGFVIGARHVYFLWILLVFFGSGLATFYLYYFGKSLRGVSGKVTERIGDVSDEVTDRVGNVTDGVADKIEKITDEVKKVKDKIVK